MKDKEKNLSNAIIIFKSTVNDNPMGKNKLTVYKGFAHFAASQSIRPHCTASDSCLPQLIALKMQKGE